MGTPDGVSVIRRGFAARSRGHSVGKVVGDPWMMPGWFLVKDARVAWEHRGQHAGDHPDYDRVHEAALALAGASRD